MRKGVGRDTQPERSNAALHLPSVHKQVLTVRNTCNMGSRYLYLILARLISFDEDTKKETAGWTSEPSRPELC